MQHITVPVSELLTMLVNPGIARINSDNNHMMAIIENDLHVLLGDFTGIDNSEDLEEIIRRNL